MSLQMMERWRGKQQDNGQAIDKTANEERDVVLDCLPPPPPSPTWLSSLRGRSGTQKTAATAIKRGANHLMSGAEPTKSNKQKSSYGLGRHGIAESNPAPAQKVASGTARKFKWGHPASVPAVELSQKQESAAATTEIIQVKVHRRIVEKVLGVRYTKIDQKVTPVDEDFKHAKLDDHDRLDEAFYKFRRLMSQQRKELRLPGSRKPYGRVVIEEEGPPLKRTACILLRPFRDEMEVTAYHAILSKSTWREHYSPLTLLYEKQKSTLDYVSAHPEARLVKAAPKDTLCGTLVAIGNEQRRRVVTIGGILQIEDKLWATTAAHSAFNEDEDSTSSNVETLTENTIRPEEYPDDVAEALIFAKSDEGTQTVPMVPPLYPSADPAASADFTTLRFLGEGEESGNDCSLILINDRAMELPNAAHVRGGDRGALGLDNAVYILDRAGRHPGPCDAEVLAGVSGSVAVKMTAGQVEVPLPSGSWVTAWECLVKPGLSGLQRGDSGSWVVNADTGTVYGQVIATMGDSVFMLPMKTLIDDIEAQRKGRGSQVTVSLPSPSTLLSNLAGYYRHIRHDTEAADRYEQASFRAAQLGISKNTIPSVRPSPATPGPMSVPESAVSKPFLPVPARAPSPGLQGRDTGKEHPPPTPVEKRTMSSVGSTGDNLAHYTHMEFFKRKEFYDSLQASDQRRIDAYLRRVTQIRGAMASEKHSSLFDHIMSSVKNWGDVIKNRDLPGCGSEHRETSLGPELSEGILHQGQTSQEFLEYDPLMDIKATRTVYGRNDAWSEPHVDRSQEFIPVKELLKYPANWLPRRTPTDTRITHIHIPATNMEWARKIIQFAVIQPEDGDYISQLLCPNSRRRTSTGTWRMRTTVSTMRRGPDLSYPFATVICVPFLDWDRLHRYNILARELREIQKDKKSGYELKVGQGRQATLSERDALPTTNPFRRPDLRKPEQEDKFLTREETPTSLKILGSVSACGNRDSQGRLLARTAVGQVLLDAANLAIAISTYRDRTLLQRYDHANGGMSCRQPFARQDPQTHRFSNDDILGRATVPEKHVDHMKVPGAVPSQHEARILMSGDLWVWVLDEYTILTCLAPRIGEDANSDPQDLQKEIHQALSEQLGQGLGLTVENILTVILEVCLGTMSKGIPKDPRDVDLMGVAEREIASLSHRAELRRSVFSNRLRTMTATTHTSGHSPRGTQRQALVKDENLSASLGNSISQLEEIVDLTTQQINALSNLARLHDMLKQKYPPGKGVMKLSQNITLVQLQLRLEGRIQELGELLRRAQKAKSCVDDLILKQI